MAFAAKVRTTPTVKPLATMNKRNMRPWELRLGLVQVVILIGVLTGAMACAFGIGYVSGQRVGFENASSANLSKLPKYPIASENVKELTDEDVTEVYANLQKDDLGKGKAVESNEESLPKIGAIKSAEVAPVVDDLVVDLLNEEESAKKEKELEDNSVEIRVLGGEELDTADSNNTLGTLITKKTEKIEVEEVNSNVSLKNNKIVEESTKPKEAVGGYVDEGKVKKVEVKEDKIKTSIAAKKKAESLVKENSESKIEVLEVGKSSDVKVSEPIKNSIYLRPQIKAGWYAQIAAPQSIKDADNLAVKLHKSGFPVAIERANVRGEVYYRVLVGPEEDRVKGDRLLKQVKREPYLVGQPFIRMIK